MAVEQSDQIAFPTLNDEQIERLRQYGTEQPVAAGQVLFRPGDPAYNFMVILSGQVDILEPTAQSEHLITTHGPGRFIGDIGLLTGQAVFLLGRMREAGVLLMIAPDQLQDIVATLPDLSEIILNAFLARRAILQQLATSGLQIIGSRFSTDTLRLRAFAARNSLPYAWLDLEADAAAETLLRQFRVAPRDTPVVIWQNSSVLRNPSNAELAHTIGLDARAVETEVVDLVVVGAGPAGLAASVYGASEGLQTIAVESLATGGQAGSSSRIENYLGFPAGLSGAELANRAAVQARRFGAHITVPRDAVSLRRDGANYAIELAGGETLRGRSIILATGARYRTLDVPRREHFDGVSIYYAATETEAQLCEGANVVVVGGGNSAGQAAVFLSGRARRVYHLIRGADLQHSMSRYLIARIEQTPNIELLPATVIRELLGESLLDGVVVEQTATGRQQTLNASAVFSFIGADPCTAWLEGSLARDEHGFILTGPALRRSRSATGWPLAERDPYLFETSLPGVFAAGDVRHGSVKRVASAVGEGSVAIELVHRLLATDAVSV